MIDARGLSCPEPVILLHRALMKQEAQYTMAVDNPVSMENAVRCGEHMGYRVRVTQQEGEFILEFEKQS